jgi:lipopolysaccharide biosynthesis glycosyltransferase
VTFPIPNSDGVLLLNLTMWREHNYTEQLFEWSKRNAKTRLYGG